MDRILIINGPNLNRLGRREPGIYGTETMESCLRWLRDAYPALEIDYFQSNTEGFIIDRLHAEADAARPASAIILNAGAYTHTSLAIADAIASIDIPCGRYHISNIAARESVRHTSMIAPVCRGSIAGFGLDSYRLAIEASLKFQ